jgi:2-methylfumaryl-CoA isomerase
VADDARVTKNPLFSRLSQPDVGEYFAPGLPAELDGVHPPAVAAPGLGQDTESLLAGRLGLDPDEITRLASAGTIGEIARQGEQG